MSQLLAKALKSDPRIQQAKDLLFEALSDQQKKIQGVKPADPSLSASYESTLEDYGKNRGGNLWYPYLGSGIGHGTLVELGDGSIKHDMICGIGPHYYGHSHHDVVDSALDAAMSDVILQGNLQQNLDSAKLVKLLTEVSGFDHCFMSTTGAHACENGLKIIFQKKHPANRVLAFEKCFMGRTLALSHVTDKAAYRVGLPDTLNVDYIPFYNAKDPEGSTRKAVAVLNEHLKRHPKKYAAMVMELVQGEGGFYPGTRDFFMALIRILKENDIAVMADEVQSFGRTNQLFAFQHFGLEKEMDVVSFGKLSQVCGTLYNIDYKPGPGLLSQTFTSSTSAIQVSYRIIRKLLNEGYFGKEGKIQGWHDKIVSRLESLSNKHPDLFSGPYGTGMMIAFTVFGGNVKRTLAFSHALFRNGVIAFTAGATPLRMRFLVPVLAISDASLDEIFEIVEKTALEMATEKCAS